MDVCVGGGQRRQVRVQRGRLVQPLERLAQRDDAVAETQAILPSRPLVHWFTGGFERAAGKWSWWAESAVGGANPATQVAWG